MTVLAKASVSRLVDAISLHNTTQVTCACVCTLPIQILSSEINSSLDEDRHTPTTPSPTTPSYVARGDLQEDLWLCMYTPGGEEEEEEERKKEKEEEELRGRGRRGEGEARAEVCIINFKRKASLFTEVCNIIIVTHLKV